MVFLKEELLAGAGLVQDVLTGWRNWRRQGTGGDVAVLLGPDRFLSGEEFPDKGVFEGAF